MLQTPPSLAMQNFHTKTITPPASLPAMAPCFVVRFQNREKSISGPKEAPKPAQAKETMRNTELSGFQARRIPIMAMPMTVPRAASMEWRVLSLMPKKSCSRS